MSESKYSKLSTLQHRMTAVLERNDPEEIKAGFIAMKDMLKPNLMQFFKKQIIYRGDGGILLVRWNLFGCKLFMIRFHKFVSSDHDCLHDHPWNFITFIIKGGYTEKLDDGLHWRRPGTVLYRKAECRHAVQLKNNTAACSIVVSFKVRRSWGFWQKGIWTHWTKFNSKNTCE
jgi:hypothetical protein